MNTFVDRPADMAELEQALLPQIQDCRQKIFVLHGLGGIGKTQLSVEFARRHYRKFSSVFWLDGRTEESLKRSIANCASRIPESQIAETSRMYSASGVGDIDAVVRDMIDWLGQPGNSKWLLIFDNVDQDYLRQDADPDAYNVTRYFSGTDNGSVLITTRVAKFAQLGVAWRLKKVDKGQAEAIFQNWYKGSYGKARPMCAKSIACI